MGTVECSLRLGLCAVLGGAGCTAWSPYLCQSDVQCADGAREGVCTPAGFCGFPDDECPSGQRYGEYAPVELARECVEVDGRDPETTGAEASPRRRAVEPRRVAGDDGSSGHGGDDDPDAFLFDETTGLEEVEVCDGFDNDGDGLVDEASEDNDVCEGCTLAQAGTVAIWACPQERPWAAAQVACAEKGGELAVVESAALQVALAELVDGQAWWIGATDLVTEGEWIWVDGSPVSYTNWGDAQPDSAGDEDCVLLAPWFQGAESMGWNDAPCRDAKAFMCTASHEP